MKILFFSNHPAIWSRINSNISVCHNLKINVAEENE